MKFSDIPTYSYRIPRYFFRKLKESFRSFLWKKNIGYEYKKNKLSLSKLKNKHKNEPCVIIGGGPSLNKMNLNIFADYVTIACNGFFLKHDEISFTPTYYTVEDPLPAEDNRQEINNIDDTIRIIPYDLKKIIDQPKNTIYVNFRRAAINSRSSKFPFYSHDFLNESFWGGTVMYFNIQLAEYLGCNPIYLIGVDLSYSVPKSVERLGAVLTSTEDDENHFDPRYTGKGKRWHLPETERMQLAFDEAYKQLKSKNIKLYNAGVDSLLQNIPTIKLY